MQDRTNAELDSATKGLSTLAHRTPEGYMVVIEQRQFEGRENVSAAPAGDGNKSN